MKKSSIGTLTRKGFRGNDLDSPYKGRGFLEFNLKEQIYTHAMNQSFFLLSLFLSLLLSLSYFHHLDKGQNPCSSLHSMSAHDKERAALKTVTNDDNLRLLHGMKQGKHFSLHLVRMH